VLIEDSYKGKSLKKKELILLTYLITLVARLFRIAIAIIAFFDLKIKQFDIVNAFANAKRLIKSLLVVY